MKYIVLFVALMCCNIGVSQAQSVVAKREFNNLLKAYFETKNALSLDQVEAAGVASEKLVKVITEFPVKTLSASEQELWAKESVLIVEAAKGVQKEETLKAQRLPFEAVANAVYALAKSFNMHNQTIYLQYCPMVKKSWLNEVEAVQNPYYGSKMFACGVVKETIEKK